MPKVRELTEWLERRIKINIKTLDPTLNKLPETLWETVKDGVVAEWTQEIEGEAANRIMKDPNLNDAEASADAAQHALNMVKIQKMVAAQQMAALPTLQASRFDINNIDNFTFYGMLKTLVSEFQRLKKEYKGDKDYKQKLEHFKPSDKKEKDIPHRLALFIAVVLQDVFKILSSNLEQMEPLEDESVQDFEKRVQKTAMLGRAGMIKFFNQPDNREAYRIWTQEINQLKMHADYYTLIHTSDPYKDIIERQLPSIDIEPSPSASSMHVVSLLSPSPTSPTPAIESLLQEMKITDRTQSESSNNSPSPSPTAATAPLSKIVPASALKIDTTNTLPPIVLSPPTLTNQEMEAQRKLNLVFAELEATRNNRLNTRNNDDTEALTHSPVINRAQSMPPPPVPAVLLESIRARGDTRCDISSAALIHHQLVTAAATTPVQAPPATLQAPPLPPRPDKKKIFKTESKADEVVAVVTVAEVKPEVAASTTPEVNTTKSLPRSGSVEGSSFKGLSLTEIFARRNRSNSSAASEDPPIPPRILAPAPPTSVAAPTELPPAIKMGRSSSHH